MNMTLKDAIIIVLSNSTHKVGIPELTNRVYSLLLRNKPASAEMCVRQALGSLSITDAALVGKVRYRRRPGFRVTHSKRLPQTVSPSLALAPTKSTAPSIDLEAIVAAATAGFETAAEKLVAELSARRAIALIRDAHKRNRGAEKAVAAC